MTARDPLTYKAAGVDIDAGEALVERIRGAVARTQRPEVLGGLGGFGGLFALAGDRYTEPVLVAGTDGVGTKIKLAIDNDAHDDIGIDLVAMCVNDVIVQGAEPLFFLDYFVTPRLDVDVAARVISGIARGCELAGHEGHPEAGDAELELQQHDGDREVGHRGEDAGVVLQVGALQTRQDLSEAAQGEAQEETRQHQTQRQRGVGEDAEQCVGGELVLLLKEDQDHGEPNADPGGGEVEVDR